eukprot:4797947-Prymnesium_polylepis.1
MEPSYLLDVRLASERALKRLGRCKDGVLHRQALARLRAKRHPARAVRRVRRSTGLRTAAARTALFQTETAAPMGAQLEWPS